MRTITLQEKAQSIFEKIAYDIYNTETLWIDDVQDDYISLQGNQSTMYDELKQYIPQLRALIKELQNELSIKTVWVGNIIIEKA